MLVQLLGQDVDADRVLRPLCGHSSIWASVWLAKDELITYDGWPVPQPRFTRRPLASRMIRLPSGKIDVIDLRLDLLPRVFFQRRHVDLVVEVADVADDGLVLHLGHVVVA